ncbi:hypothetical protein BGW80DRAFT_1276765, partial [Lactifluus volemus]
MKGENTKGQSDGLTSRLFNRVEIKASRENEARLDNKIEDLSREKGETKRGKSTLSSIRDIYDVKQLRCV